MVESSLDGVEEEIFEGCGAVFIVVDFFVTIVFLYSASHSMLPRILLSVFRLGEVRSTKRKKIQLILISRIVMFKNKDITLILYLRGMLLILPSFVSLSVSQSSASNSSVTAIGAIRFGLPSIF